MNEKDYQILELKEALMKSEKNSLENDRRYQISSRYYQKKTKEIKNILQELQKVDEINEDDIIDTRAESID